jgi:hypothetical protein
VIPDETITRYLSGLFGNSEPGARLHQMMFATAALDDLTALGLPDPAKLQLTIYAIAPTGEVDADAFVAQSIAAAIAEAHHQRIQPWFAGLAMERVMVGFDGNEVSENLARRLRADRKLQDHPASTEATELYAACRDGRRWWGRHLLTGDRAGKITGPMLMGGPLRPREQGPHQALIRQAVGLMQTR